MKSARLVAHGPQGDQAHHLTVRLPTDPQQFGIGQKFIATRGRTAPDHPATDEGISGGKISPTSGQPVDRLVTVAALQRGCRQSFGRTQVPLGDGAAVRIGGSEIAPISIRTQAHGLVLFRNLGIEPTQRKRVVVRSTNDLMAVFGPIARKVICVDPAGPLGRDDRKIPHSRPFSHVNHPIWPLDEATAPGLIARPGIP